MKKRKIPATMVTQHPDHASKPYWHYRAYITTEYESKEAYLSFAELNATEYKWDWEGKLVDESVVERFFGEHFEYFSKNPLGEEKFLTFRLPNPRVETEFRLLRAFINMASAGSVAKHFGFTKPPIFEVILPLTETAEEMLSLQEAFAQIHSLKHPLFRLEGFLTNLRVIPLFEDVTTIINSDKILEKYLKIYKKRFKKLPPYMRPYVARSDPALNSGLIPTVLAIKIALSRFKKLEKKLKIPLYPVIGAGSLPFRGGINPESVVDFANEYKGIRTVTIQSAFRYDYPLPKVKAAIEYLETNLVKQKAINISEKEEKELLGLISEGSKLYKNLISEIAPIVNLVSQYIPQRRERFQHIGLFGYSRGEKGVKLPRAISFTGSMYSLGIPPELLASGKLIEYAIKTKKIKVLEKYYVNMQKDLIKSGKYLNKENLVILSHKSLVFSEILESVDLIEKYLGKKLGPTTISEKKHSLLSKKLLENVKNKELAKKYLKQAARLRRSMG